MHQGMLILAATLSLAAAPAELIKAPTPHPRKNMVISYEVDPRWPRPRPAGVEWKAIPSVIVDRQDRVWIFTRAKPPVQIYSREGKYLGGWGSEHIRTAHGLRFDPQGHVWTTDAADHVVMEFTPEGRPLRTLGTRGTLGEDATHFNRPTDVAVSPQGEIFIADGYGNNRIVHFDRQGRFVKAWGRMGTAAGDFSLPHSIVLDARGRLYVADRNNARVQVFDQQGRFLAEWRNVMVPWGLTIMANDEIWACGCSPMTWRPTDRYLSCPPKDQLIVRFDTTGRVLQQWFLPLGQEGHEQPGELDWIHAVAPDSHGDLYVGDIIGKRVQKLLRHE